MTAARPVLPLFAYMVTRRVTARKYLLLPNRVVKKVCRYILGESRRRYGVWIHAFVFMGNHYHCLFTDPESKAPKFYHFLHTHVARALNKYRGRKENFWEFPAQTHWSIKLTPDEVLASIVYLVTNPVKAGLVCIAREWEGAISHTRPYCEDHEVVVDRPNFYFDPANWPEQTTLVLTKPPGFDDFNDEQFHALVRREVAKKEQEIQAEMKAAGRRFKGRAAIRATDPEDSAVSEPKPKPRRPRRPSFQKEWCDWLKRWRHAYREARELLLQGARAVFPVGTYWLKHHAGVDVGTSPIPPPNPLTL